MVVDLAADDDLYKAIILEHYSRPPHKGPLPEHTHYDEGINPSCGDEIELFIKVDDDVVQEVNFDGVGCSICLASASMLARLSKTGSPFANPNRALLTWMNWKLWAAFEIIPCASNVHFLLGRPSRVLSGNNP